MHLIGLDIGFSKRRRSNGIAVFRDGAMLRDGRLSVDERDEALRQVRDADVVAIDAPIVSPGTPDTLARHCEHIFSRGAFQKRCKPGMSHVRGTGQTLRAHGRRAAEQLIGSGAKIVEAFPNAFLGVVLPEEDFIVTAKIKRGRKFDWLYERWIERRLFARIAAAAELPNALAAKCEAAKNHDVRAALVCLLTAAFVARGRYSRIGETAGGYFYLAPFELWAAWARREIS